MIRILIYFLLVFFLMGVSIFATQNQQPVNLKFTTLESINLPLGLVLIFSAGLGSIVITGLQVSNLNSSRSEVFSPPISSRSSFKSKPQPVKSSRDKTRDEIKDFDDDFDDDWG